MGSSVGIIIANIWKKHVPNHQPGLNVDRAESMFLGVENGRFTVLIFAPLGPVMRNPVLDLHSS
jgi:hypothetical protein